MASASAAGHTFKVKSTADVVHGSCAKKCTLRDAVIAADHAGGLSTILVPAGTYKLTIKATAAGTPTDNPAVGDFDINNGVSVTLKGAGSSKTVLNGDRIDRLFAVHAGGSLSISGVTVKNGAQADVGGASDDSISPGYGGAFYNDGTLKIGKSVLDANTAYHGGGVVYSDTGAALTSITDSIATQNTTDGGGGAVGAAGGKIDLSGDGIFDNYGVEEGGALYGTHVGSVTISHTKMEYNSAGNISGGAVSLDTAGKVSIAHSLISHSADFEHGGAAFFEYTGAISVTDSTISNDAANAETGYNGGGFYVFATGRLTVTGSTFANDFANVGGAIYLSGVDLSVKSSHFTDNAATNAGAIFLDGSSGSATQSVEKSVFTGNLVSDDYGGGIDDTKGALSVSASTFSNNSAYNGGGIYYASGEAMSLVNDTFDSNTSDTGGALYLNSAPSTGQVVLRNDTIARNSAFIGGGIESPYYASQIENTIVADNSAIPGHGAPTGDNDCELPFDYLTFTADAGHNLDSDHSCIVGTSASGDRTASPKLGPLKSNGGPVPTDALLPGSPAIGHADAADCPATDARGVKRGSKCDIGAYQHKPKPKRKHKKK